MDDEKNKAIVEALASMLLDDLTVSPECVEKLKAEQILKKEKKGKNG